MRTAVRNHPASIRRPPDNLLGYGLANPKSELFGGTKTITVPAALVPYLRGGLFAEYGSALDVLELTIDADVVNRERWRAGNAQLDCSRDLLDRVGVGHDPRDFDLHLELSAPGARMILDAMRAIYEVEVQRLADAAAERVHLPLREVPTLRNFVVDAEKQLGRFAKRQHRILDVDEKRSPRSVKAGRQVKHGE